MVFCAVCLHEKLVLHLLHIEINSQIWQNLNVFAGSDAWWSSAVVVSEVGKGELTQDFSSVECTLFSGNLLFSSNIELHYFCSVDFLFTSSGKRDK